MELDEVFGVSIFSAASLIIYTIETVYIGADYTAVWVSMSSFLTTTSSTSYYKTPYFFSKMVRA